MIEERSIHSPKSPQAEFLRVEEGDFLYVPYEEVEAALEVGAIILKGESRLVIPKPMPDGMVRRDFRRWQTAESRHKWLHQMITGVVGEGYDDGDIDTLMETLGNGTVAHERVYLFVPSFDAVKARTIPGIRWDRRRRMYYATPETDLNLCFEWMTPASKRIWQSELAINRSLTLLMQQKAMEVKDNWDDGDEVGEKGYSTIKQKNVPGRTSAD